MATQVILTFSDGKLAIPLEVQEQMHLTEEAQLRLILAGRDRLVLEPAETLAEPKEPSEWEWHGASLRGILDDHPEHDTSKARADERAWELEHDESKFGPFPKR